jgi:hypothetical protein
MPAVLLSRLEQQILAFSSAFNQPKVFVSDLFALLDLYSDRTYHASYEIPSSSKMLSFRVPSVVIHELELKFHHLAMNEPNEALLVADELWQGKKLELKELGISLLGFIPSELSYQVMNRIENWAIACPDGFLLENLMNKSSQMILREKPLLWLENARKWLTSKESKCIILGLKSLEVLTKTETFLDLPQIYNSLLSSFHSSQVDIFPEMHHLFTILCQKHSIETVAFLKQMIHEKSSPSLFRLIRKLLPVLPNSLQNSLRQEIDKDNEINPSFIKTRDQDQKNIQKISSKKK